MIATVDRARRTAAKDRDFVERKPAPEPGDDHLALVGRQLFQGIGGVRGVEPVALGPFEPRLAEGLRVLDRAAEPNESATELPVLAPIRLLVAAAARQGGRQGLPDDQWRMLVVSAASAKTPVDPAK